LVSTIIFKCNITYDLPILESITQNKIIISNDEARKGKVGFCIEIMRSFLSIIRSKKKIIISEPIKYWVFLMKKKTSKRIFTT